MRRRDTMSGREVEECRKDEEMTAPITITSLDESTVVELRRRYDETTDAETRTRYQILLLSLRGLASSQIAQIVLRSQDTVVRVLKWFFTGGLDAVPRRTAPGRERTVTAARVRRIAARDRVGSSRSWTRHGELDHRTTRQLSGPAHRDPGHRRDGTGVLTCSWLRGPRVLSGHSGARPKRNPIMWETRGSVEVLLAGATALEPLPVHDLVEADLWDQLPADLLDLLV